MTTYCGIMLTGEKEKPCGLAFISDEGVTTHSTTGDEEIMSLLEDNRPKIIALNAPAERAKKNKLHESPDDDDESALDPETSQMFTKDEEELVNEGHALLPQEMRDQQLLERAEFLVNTVKRAGIGAQFIQSKPNLIAETLNVEGDTMLEAYGIDTSDIEHVREHDALLLAFTAKRYDEEDYEDKDIILPE